MKRILSNIAAAIWFVAILLWMIPLMLVTLPILWYDIWVILESGFGLQNVGFSALLVFAFGFGLTLLIPAFRRCFRMLPWLYPFALISTMDLFIFTIAIEILNYGYSVQNATRHTIFFVIMLIQIIVFRLVMCIYCHKKQMRIARDEYEQ